MADTLDRVTGLQKGPARPTREGGGPEKPVVGQWYRIREGAGWRLACVTHLGSNYVGLEGVYSSWRIHEDNWAQQAEPAPDAQEEIQRHITEHRTEVFRLMEEARQLALSLGIAPRALQEGEPVNETQALALRAGNEPIEQYKAALIKAQKETLPEIFKKIKDRNERMARWMKAELIPLEAQVQQLEPAIGAIKARVFNVELYAGLKEQVVQVREGEPAPMHTPIHLFQRRHYMDEECLAQYEAGGMEFKDLPDFDAWMARPVNFERLLPLPRCIVAFRVRRHDKEREFPSLHAYLQFAFGGGGEEDKYTYLYLRNGEQLYRLRTGIEFGERLFPDLEQRQLDETLYAEVGHFGRVESVVTEGEYEGLQQDAVRLKAEYEAKLAATPKKDRWRVSDYEYRHVAERLKQMVRWDQETVYFDDITAYINKQVELYNRIALVLQGLLDRSPVFHPHPAWQLYSPEGFAQAIKLVLDEDRAITPGEAPDFEAYRARLNASLKVGSLTVGQDDYWQEREAEKENAKSRGRSLHYQRFRPYGDSGPGLISRIVALTRTNATFKWEKEPEWRTTYRRRRDWRYKGDENAGIPRSVVVPRAVLLNVDAYTPGDFKQFFNDPRTRADYLQWAPLLLEAEEYHAGNREVGSHVRKSPRGHKLTREGGVDVETLSEMSLGGGDEDE